MSLPFGRKMNGRCSAMSLSVQELVACAAGSESCDRQGCEQLGGFPLASLQRGLGTESEWKQPPFPSGGWRVFWGAGSNTVTAP